MNKCKTCPRNSLLSMCRQVHCDEHRDNPMIALMLEEINQLEYELGQAEYDLAVIESKFNSDNN